MGKPNTSIIWKTSDRRASRNEIWRPGVSGQCIQVTFDSYVVKVILGSLGSFPIFDKIVSHKWVFLKRNGAKFGPRVCVLHVYRVLLTVAGMWFHRSIDNCKH